MFNYNNFPYGNPYQQPVQVVRVNGENGARAYSLPPNSSSLLIDEKDAIVYLITTDGAGYKTVMAYAITPIEHEAPAGYGELLKRIEKLEGIVNESNASTTKQKQPGKSNNAD